MSWLTLVQPPALVVLMWGLLRFGWDGHNREHRAKYFGGCLMRVLGGALVLAAAVMALLFGKATWATGFTAGMGIVVGLGVMALNALGVLVALWAWPLSGSEPGDESGECGRL